LADELAATLPTPTPLPPPLARGPRTKGEGASFGSDQSGIVVALRRARELSPGDARYRAELALRRAGTKEEQEAASDERYMVPSQTILSRRQGMPKEGTVPDVADRQLYWLRAVVTRADKRISQLIQYAREIVIRAANARRAVRRDPGRGRSHGNSARAGASQRWWHRVSSGRAQRGNATAHSLARTRAGRCRRGGDPHVDESAHWRPWRCAVLLSRLLRLARRRTRSRTTRWSSMRRRSIRFTST